MKRQSWWTVSFWCILLVFITDVWSSVPNELLLNDRFPDKDEAEVCGTIRDVIQRDSGRFRRTLIRDTNDQIDYIDEDARRMTSRAKSKLDVLTSLVSN